MSWLIRTLEDKRESASKTWKKIADFILSDINQATSLKLKEFSKRAQVSEGSIINFVQSLGYSGYIEFKVGLAQAVGKISNSFVLEDDGINAFIQITDAVKKSYEETLAVLKKDIIERITKKIMQAKGRVCVCGKASKGKVITKKPILPGKQELEENSRSKSAKLRVFEKA
jgi:DNA-binding MurR/RpiR family transcriptional regulator